MKTNNKITPEKLSFNEFVEAFRAQCKYGYPQFNSIYKISEQIVRKNNRKLHGMIIRVRESRIAPVFYYEDFYKSYKNGMTIDECICQILQFLDGKRMPGDEFGENLTVWEKNKDYLVLKMINYKKNREMLRNKPYCRFGDMAVIVQIYLDDPKLGKGAITVDEDLLALWDVSSEALFENANANMLKYQVKMIDLLDYASEKKEVDPDTPRIYVVSYDAPFNGASAMLRMDTLLSFAQKKSKDFFVMPVSVYEFLLIEYRNDISNEFLFDMLNSINSERGMTENMLSEEVFVLNRENHCLHNLSDGKELKLMNA